ncbi:MAG: TIGR02186 family protein [Gemmobacter sp.]
MIRAMLLALFCAAPAPVLAQETIVAGLSHASVSITAGFTGEEILIYGAVRREAPPPPGPPLQVIVTVEGPAAPVIVRKKARRAGIWVNTDAVLVDSAPSFYAVASTAPLDDVLSPVDDLRHRITIPRAIRAVGITSEAENAPAFVTAMVRLREAAGSYRLTEGDVSFAEATLFRTDVALPANLVEGDYRVRLFLTRGGAVVDWQEQVIPVRKAGLERAIFALSREKPLAYGLLSVSLAILAGWAAAAVFRLLRA